MGVNRDYTTYTQAVATSAAVDLDEVKPADDKPCQVMGGVCANYTDFGDAQDEVLRIAIRRGDTVSGSGGSAPTVRANQFHDAAAGFATEADNTTKANTSGIVILTDGWNVRDPNPKWWLDGFAPSADQGNTAVVRELVSAPADSLTVDHSLFVREF